MSVFSRPADGPSSLHPSERPGWCQGCQKTFLPSGLLKHLTQTRKLNCLAWRSLRNAALSMMTLASTSSVSAEQPPPDEEMEIDSVTTLPPSLKDCDMDEEPIPFGGDYFGDYVDDFFTDSLAQHPESPTLPTTAQRAAMENATRRQTFVVRYPSAHTGAPIPNVARWAKLRGPGSTALDELLAIEEVAEHLALSFNTSSKLNKIVDKQLSPARPRFERHEIVVAGEAFEVYICDILACIESLFSDPEFAPLLLLVPKRHYADTDQTDHVYFDMNTGKWWWSTQKRLENKQPGATVVPVIVSSDKTQLAQFGNKTAYPVYMTIGNLPKHVRCKPSHTNLFHTCMSRVLAPLTSAGVNGMELVSGDSLIRRGHPILATYVGDYPEQVLVTGCKTGECPKLLDTLAALDEGPRAFAHACREVGIKPLPHPFWQDLPYMNIFLAITPDEAYGTEEINARCRRLPLNNSLRHFASGISHMSRVTGKEHQDISCILLGLIVGLPLPGGLSPVRLVRATRALLHFLYLTQYPTHTAQTLDLLEQHLQAFHDNKAIFVDLRIRTHFDLPKLHSLNHYRRSIELFGTMDNYDTQYSERLHIDFTKNAYHATNKKDELAQMTLWLERKEKILRHDKYIQWQLQQLPSVSAATTSVTPAPVNLPDSGLSLPPTRIYMSRHASVKGVTFERIKTEYAAPFFRDALARFVIKFSNPEFSPQQVEYESVHIFFGFFKNFQSIIRSNGLEDPGTLTRDVVHAHAARMTRCGASLPGRFDTALIRYRVVQVHVVFKIPERGLADLFLHVAPERRPQHLVYVELFIGLDTKGADHGMYKISPASNAQGEHLAMIVPVEDFERSCHLFPHFGPTAPREWTYYNVLDTCTTFYVNLFADRNTYKLVY
ncbi:hypothetical protein BD309DRAFT_994361 [Dichomitus squalens]|nr:hypothetical protein BD309DRAFT_994361 [Dichomitus squalens]